MDEKNEELLVRWTTQRKEEWLFWKRSLCPPLESSQDIIEEDITLQTQDSLIHCHERLFSPLIHQNNQKFQVNMKTRVPRESSSFTNQLSDIMRKNPDKHQKCISWSKCTSHSKSESWDSSFMSSSWRETRVLCVCIHMTSYCQDLKNPFQVIIEDRQLFMWFFLCRTTCAWMSGLHSFHSRKTLSRMIILYQSIFKMMCLFHWLVLNDNNCWGSSRFQKSSDREWHEKRFEKEVKEEQIPASLFFHCVFRLTCFLLTAVTGE
jgi:hypothetical protein